MASAGEFTAGKFSEELFVSDLAALKEIKKHPEFIVDHMTPYGFELYGPKGTGEWLASIGYKFEKSTEIHAKNATDPNAIRYPSFAQIEAFLKKIVATRPDIAKLISIGKSAKGRDLWVVKISDNVEKDELEPEFKYISSMHGNEITGRELTQYLIKDLIEGYGKDAEITKLINNTEIYIMPSMNPDGSKKKQRANANGYDLNRNFPDWVNGDVNTSIDRQPETKAMMKFQAQRKFSLSANFHGGAVVVNYPWDSTYTRHPFNAFLMDISKRYASLNPAMRNSRSFNDGITNGADWYVLNGGMQDWSYFWYDDLQVTIELSGTKWPRYSDIASYYKDNKDSMLAYLKVVHQGAGFTIQNSTKSGRVKVVRNLSDGTEEAKGSFTYTGGNFYKVLPEGEYTFKVQQEGSAKITNVNVSVDRKINNKSIYKTLTL